MAVSRIRLNWLPGQLVEKPAFIVMAIILLIYLILGCFIDALAMILLTIPIFYPIAVDTLGYDPIWFGVIIVLVVAMGVITPPVGMNIYILKVVVPDIPLETMFKGIWPFLFAVIICLVLIMLFPQVATSCRFDRPIFGIRVFRFAH